MMALPSVRRFVISAARRPALFYTDGVTERHDPADDIMIYRG
jgi:hypothetical protein